MKSVMIKEGAAQNFVVYLQEDFERRKKTKKKFSLRDYARYLEIEPSVLSKILRGRRAVTYQTLSRLGTKLNLKRDDLDKFKNLTLQAIAVKPRKKTSPPKINELPPSCFHPISKWYYPTILELIKLRDFHEDPFWIAKKIKITPDEARAALKSLEEHKYVQRIDKKLFVNPESYRVLPKEGSPDYLKALQKTFLEKSIKAVDEVPLALRDHGVSIMALRADRLEEAKKLIKKFRLKLMALVDEKASNADAVYLLSTSLVPLTEKEK